MKVTTEAKAYATKVQDHIVDFDFRPKTADTEIKLAVLEDVHTRLLSGELTKQDAAEALKASADHFKSVPPAFPLHIYPPWLRKYCAEVAAACEVPAGVVEFSLLGMLGGGVWDTPSGRFQAWLHPVLP